MWNSDLSPIAVVFVVDVVWMQTEYPNVAIYFRLRQHYYSFGPGE